MHAHHGGGGEGTAHVLLWFGQHDVHLQSDRKQQVSMQPQCRPYDGDDYDGEEDYGENDSCGDGDDEDTDVGNCREDDEEVDEKD